MDLTLIESTGEEITLSVTTGEAGPGVPGGGTAGQILAKASGLDYNTHWIDPPSGGGGGGGPITINGVTNTTFTITAASLGAIATSARGAASGVAALGSTGLVPTNQLGTGTASSTTFLRGDGTWQAPAGSTGVTDHGALTGLSDDDHPQYHTDSRAATWLATQKNAANGVAGITAFGLLNPVVIPFGIDADTVAEGDHTHSIGDVVNLQTNLDLKANASTSLAFIRYSTGTSSYPIRSTATTSSTRTVVWIGPVAPTAGGSYAVTDVDIWWDNS